MRAIKRTRLRTRALVVARLVAGVVLVAAAVGQSSGDARAKQHFDGTITFGASMSLTAASPPRPSGQGRLRLLRQADQREGRHQGRRQDVQGRDQYYDDDERTPTLGAALRKADQRGQDQAAARAVLERRHVRRRARSPRSTRCRWSPRTPRRRLDLRARLQVHLRDAERRSTSTRRNADQDGGERPRSTAPSGRAHQRERAVPEVERRSRRASRPRTPELEVVYNEIYPTGTKDFCRDARRR